MIDESLYNMRKIIIAAIIFLLSGSIFCKIEKSSPMVNNATVKELNLQKYLGVWYEIARYPHSFEKNLAGVTATYELKTNGKIKVTNKGYKNSLDGRLKESIGKAYVPNKKEPGKFKVSFFLLFYADYFVLELDPDYQWALVGSSSSKYLWILSRKPRMNEATFNTITAMAKMRGYDVSKLIRVPQS